MEDLKALILGLHRRDKMYEEDDNLEDEWERRLTYEEGCALNKKWNWDTDLQIELEREVVDNYRAGKYREIFKKFFDEVK